MRHLLAGLALVIALLTGFVPGPAVHAQDAIDLPTELYVLLNTGVVQRVGLGTAGVSSITPEDTFILDFAIAPNNTLLAYRTEDGLFTLPLYAESAAPQPIEDATAGLPPLRGRGASMAWSPAGDAIAYTTSYGARAAFQTGDGYAFADMAINPVIHLAWSPGGSYLAAESEGDIWWIFRRDGAALNLVAALPASAGLSWADDSRFVFAPPEGGLLLLDLADTNRQTPLVTDGLYRLPYVRQDGLLLAFVIDTPDAQTGLLRRFQLDLTAPGAAPIDLSETPVETAGLRWAPGGVLMVALRGGVPAAVVAANGQGFAPPVAGAVAYAWGAARPPSVEGFRLTYEGFFLAADFLTGANQLYRLPRNGLAPVRLTESETDITAYAVAPDGQGIVYVAGGQVFTAPLDPAGPAGEPVALTAGPQVEGAQVQELALSPQATTLAYTEATSAGSTVYLLDLAPPGDSEAAPVPQPIADPAGDNYRAPRFAPNVAALLLQSNTGLTLYDISNAAARPLGDFTSGHWLSDGRVLATRVDASGAVELLVLDPTQPDFTPQVVLRAAETTVRDVVEIAPGRLRALLARQIASGRESLALVEVRVDSGEPDEVALLPPMTLPRLAPDGLFVAGQTQPGGALVIYSAAEDTALTLSRPAVLEDFLWAMFR